MNDGDELLRVIGEEGEDYLYPINYFEPYREEEGAHATETITVHVRPFLRNILRAEALAAQESISALAREWLEDRLDLAA
jgi:hypothetical protein